MCSQTIDLAVGPLSAIVCDSFVDRRVNNYGAAVRRCRLYYLIRLCVCAIGSPTFYVLGPDLVSRFADVAPWRCTGNGEAPSSQSFLQSSILGSGSAENWLFSTTSWHS